MQFLADTMLGKLAKWLRVMGYDVHYQTHYPYRQIERFVQEGRILLSRHRKVIDRYPGALFIVSDHVGDQLLELRQEGHLKFDPSRWFTRCLLCNTPLEKASPSTARENVPEYVFYKNSEKIRYCPSCMRYFWPGTHRQRMVRQLSEWGWVPNQKERA